MSAPVTHVDADALAEFRAGLITGRHGAKIAAHLAGCDRCAALDGQLAGVSALLASVPAPPMPEHVAQRLDTVLAAEVASRNDPERAGRQPSPDTAAAPRRAGSRRFRLPSLRVLAPVAAAAAVILAAGGYGLSLIASGPGNQMTASSAAGVASRAAKAIGTPNGSAPGGAAPFDSAAPAPSARTEMRPRASIPVVTSSTDFQQAGLEQQVISALKTAHPASPGQHVRACVQKVADGATLIRVILAHYEGRPATIIVARTGQGNHAWVAGPDCSGTNRDVVAQTSLPAGIS